MNSHTYVIVAKTSILPIPEYYPSFHATGLPFRPRLLNPLLPTPILPNRYMENFSLPVTEFTLFAKLLNSSVHDSVQTDAFDRRYRLASRVELNVLTVNGKLSVLVKPGNSGQSIETDFGVEKTPVGTFTPAAPRLEEIIFKQNTPTRFDFGWIVLGRPHRLAEPLFEEVCHRDCVYIWHRVVGHIKVENGFTILRVNIAGSRFPTQALFLNHKQRILTHQGALGNLWVSDQRDPKRVTGTGPSEYAEPLAFGGGKFGGGGAGGNW